MAKKKLIVYVDIGHNVKNDNGSVGGISENACTQQIGTALIEMLNKWGYDARKAFTEASKKKVEAIKDRDKALLESLRLRCREANDNNADYYISIHLNSNPDGVKEEDKNRGAMIMVKTNEEKALANNILRQITNQHYDLGGAEFSDGQKRLGKPYKNGGVKDGSGLYVLRKTNCPAILIENLFVNHPIDVGLYKDEKPYVNHERTKLEEGVLYVNENVFSYNFFAYCIARGFNDYIKSNGSLEFNPSDVDIFDMENTELNYVTYTQNALDTDFEVKMHQYGNAERLNSKRLVALLKNQGIKGGMNKTVCFLPYKNYNTVQGAYGSIMHDSFAMEEVKFKNLANLGEVKSINGRKAVVFTLKNLCNVYRSAGSSYCTLSRGDVVGVYINRKNVGYGNDYNTEWEYEDYSFAKGPIVCEPTKPNWIKVNFCIKRNGEFEELYNQFSGDDYAWIETNLDGAYDLKDFVLSLKGV